MAPILFTAADRNSVIKCFDDLAPFDSDCKEKEAAWREFRRHFTICACTCGADDLVTSKQPDTAAHLKALTDDERPYYTGLSRILYSKLCSLV